MTYVKCMKGTRYNCNETAAAYGVIQITLSLHFLLVYESSPDVAPINMASHIHDKKNCLIPLIHSTECSTIVHSAMTEHNFKILTSHQPEFLFLKQDLVIYLCPAKYFEKL